MKDEYDFKESKQNPYAKKFDDIVESSWLNSLAKLIKKFKSSKSYWSVSYIVILFTLREAGALVYGTILKEYVQKHLEGSDYTWLWSAIEFVFGFGGSVDLVILGLFFFVVLSLVKISEGENNTISLKENFLSLLLSFAIVGMSIYMIRSNMVKHKEISKKQKIMIENDKKTHKLLIKLVYGNEIELLGEYFGKENVKIINSDNFKKIQKETGKSTYEILRDIANEKRRLATMSFGNAKLEYKIKKAFKELRYKDARELIGGFLESNSDKEKEIIKAHYLKALTYMNARYYEKAKNEFDKIAMNITNPKILFDKGRLYGILGKSKKSNAFYDKAINDYRKMASKEKNRYKLSSIYNNIGLVYNGKGEYSKAIKYYKKSLEIELSNPQNNPFLLPEIYNNIGLAWGSMGNFNKAIMYYEKDIEIKLHNLGKNHISVATSYNNLGATWASIGEYDKAIEYYGRSLKITLATLGENHPSTAISYNNLGSAWDSKGEYDKAIEYYERALMIFRKVFPSGHPNIDAVEYNLKSAKESLKNAN